MRAEEEPKRAAAAAVRRRRRRLMFRVEITAPCSRMNDIRVTQKAEKEGG